MVQDHHHDPVMGWPQAMIGEIQTAKLAAGLGSPFTLVLPFGGPGHAGNLEDGPPGPGPTPAEARP